LAVVCGGWSLWLGWWSVRGSGSWVPHHVKRRSSTRPFADSCRAICLISVTDRPWRMVSMAWVFAHPWRSAVARCVTSKRTDLAEEPKPPHVVKANGENPHPFASHTGPSACTFWVSARLQCFAVCSTTRGCCATPAGWVHTKSTATCWPRDQFMRRMSAGLLPARHSASFTTATLCCAHTAKKASRKALCLCELPLRSQHTK
jgi:hypothetical protein